MRRILSILFATVGSLMAQVPSSHFYAVQTHLGQRERTDIDSIGMEMLLDAVQNAGVTSIRDECWWSDVEQEKGVFTFPRSVDRLVHAAQRRGLKILMILNYNNRLYAPQTSSGPVSDSNRIGYARYCQEVVRRYSSLGVKAYEIWNEPNIKQFWGPQPAAIDYLSLLKTAYPAIKAVDSNVTVIGGATSPAESDRPGAGFIPWLPFFTGLFQNGAGKYMDGVSFHLYRVDRGPESYLYDDVRNLQNIVGPDRQLWLTEIGYPTSAVWPKLSLDDQANAVARLYLLGRSIPQLVHISYYDFRDDGKDSTDNEANFGLMLRDDSPKPSYFALKTVKSIVGNKTFNGLTRTGDTYVESFGSPGERTLAIWTSGKPETRTINTGMTNQVMFDRDGNRLGYAEGDSLVSVNITPQPKYFVARSPVAPVRPQMRRPRNIRR